MWRTLKRMAIGDGSRPAAAAHLPAGRDVQRYLIAALAGGTLCLGVAVWCFGGRILVALLVAWAAGAAVEIAFGLIRRKPIGSGSLPFALLLTLMLPPDLPLWMFAVGSAFGVFFGKEVFGGAGHHIFSPVLVGKGFLLFSYPTAVLDSYFGSMLGAARPDAWIACSAAILLASVPMLLARRTNLLIMAGVFLAAGATAFALQIAGRLPVPTLLEVFVADGFLFGACLLACDPAGSPHDPGAKVLYGILIGTAAVLMRAFSNYTEAMLAAVLLGNLVSPTIDALTLAGARPHAP
ncbi:MAG: RnfABCDGE type electron transport complex subunit D [Kiritimatiellae bacterium]|nr:RnfABCDGE type electron transport complex subunit D [Kiritimatiellia bacterium]